MNEGRQTIVEDKGKKLQHFVRHNLLFVAVMSMFAVLAAFLVITRVVDEVKTEERQEVLEPFYTPSDPLPFTGPGQVLKQEELGVDVPGGTGLRVLYLSELADGTAVVTSGMVFYPSTPSPEGGRPVVAWSHPTVGMGEQCAPSRSDAPLSDMTWLDEMLKRGWVVTATDYAGLGTPGTEHYLVGRDEARDVINSVRAVRQLPQAAAGSRYAVWGHSQGGHAALFTAMEADAYAPDLQLVAVAAAAPAAELTALFNEQYQSVAGWVIGPEVLVSWPLTYTHLDIDDVITDKGREKYEEMAADCLKKAGEEALARNILKEDFFRQNPMEERSWYDAAVRETAAPMAPGRPLLIIQGLDDKVVLPNTTALYVMKSCQAGSDVTTLWLEGVDHEKAAAVGGPTAVFWLEDRFNGKPTSNSCGQIMPISPANPPDAPDS
ncbi:MAG: lipase family protein [Thermoleophilia bacterium]